MRLTPALICFFGEAAFTTGEVPLFKLRLRQLAEERAIQVQRARRSG